MSNFRKSHRTVKNKNLKTSSTSWMKRHLNDVFVQQAKRDEYKSRAAYKLLEIHEKYNIFLNDGPILDLGCAPGSWSQVVKKITPNVKVLGIDLININPPQGVDFICGDLFDEITQQNMVNFAKTSKYSVIMSDISPSTTGIKTVDHLRILNVCEQVFVLSQNLLKNNGTMICKLFHGNLERNFFDKIKKNFDLVEYFKPKSSRKESNEIYLIAKRFKFN